MKSTKKFFRIAVTGMLAISMLLPNSLAMYQAKVKADALYLRESPGGDVIGTLSQNTVVAVLNNSNSWYKVVSNGKVGYVSGEYLTGTTTTDFSLGKAKIVCDTTVNFRSQPNTSSSVLASLKNGTVVDVTGVKSNWFKVTYNGKTGYVHPDYISFSATQGTSSNSGSSASNNSSNSETIVPSANAVSYTGSSEKRAEVLEYAAQFLGTPYE